MEGLARTLVLLVKISTDDRQTSSLVETALLVIRAFLKQAVEKIARIRLVRPILSCRILSCILYGCCSTMHKAEHFMVLIRRQAGTSSMSYRRLCRQGR